MDLPFEDIIERLERIESILGHITQNNSPPQPEDDSDQFLTSIVEIANFLKIGKTKAQEIKNQNQNVFAQNGRRFWVKKDDLLKAINILK